MLLFGQKWLCYSAVLAQNALQGVSCILLVFWLINSPEICSLQPLSLWVQQWEGLPLGRSLERAVLPTHDHHVNTKEEDDKIVKIQGSFIRERIDLKDGCYFYQPVFIWHKDHIFNFEHPLAKLWSPSFSFASLSCINVIKFLLTK